MRVFNVLWKLVGWLFVILLLLFGYVIYSVYDKYFSEIKIESSIKIKPDYRIESNGIKTDTIYIYTFKR